LIITVNLSTSNGHDSLNLIAWEIKREPKAKTIRKVSNREIAIATTLFIRILTKKSTSGLSKIAIIVAKTSGIIMLFAIYNIANRAIAPIKKMVTFAEKGKFSSSFVTAF